MKVKLLKYTQDPEKTCAVAARLCYSAVGVEELNESMTEAQVADLLNRVIKSGHHSVLEHVSFSFAVEGVSRALLAQLTRHRLASFSVQSQRYVKFKNGVENIIPPTIEKNAAMLEKFKNLLLETEKLYLELTENGIPQEDARYILPQASSTKIFMTMNARELRHFFAIRACRRAQWEINNMAIEMLSLARKAAPLLFKTAGPSCVLGSCFETSPCSQPHNNTSGS
ncbi:MAG: FAD-dependent thymidylate synthase [Elusimicrobia bacterium]|nr:FAD-dependent thymidylate synthase [Elusimicrobiota bacterium]